MDTYANAFTPFEIFIFITNTIQNSLPQTNDTAINLDHEEWILSPDKTLLESDIRESVCNWTIYSVVYKLTYNYNYVFSNREVLQKV